MEKGNPLSQPRENPSAQGAERPSQDGLAVPQQPARKPRRVLLLDRTPALRPLLEQAPALTGAVSLLYAQTLAEARAVIAAGPIDVAIIEPDLADGSGLDLADELKGTTTPPQTVVVSSSTDFAQAQQAMRAGASDYILRPLGDDVATQAGLCRDLSDRIGAALERQAADREQHRRVRRLKKLCKRLDDARQEVTDQVDVLCNDLVTAYQELANQINHLSNTTDLSEVIGDELDLEVLLRKTLEYLIKKAGPCNAAIFLPSTADEFSLGGYVNYDCTKDSADMLLEHLADVLAPKIADHCEEMILHVDNNHGLTELLGDDWNYLADCHLLSFACSHEGDALAVVALFRDDSEPFSPAMIETAATIGEMLGEQLARIIRVHHRGMADVPYDTTAESVGETFLPPSEWDGYHQDADPFEDEDGDDDGPFA